MTCTTWTTWSRNFRWDSTNPCLDMNDEDEPEPGAKPRRKGLVDDGTLSDELMTEIFAGDPDNEGVVWPRVAELSLLGAVGSGRWLVQLIIDGLEAPDSPYRYVVTQATDGSIPFYERMGFVRMGAVQCTKRPEVKEPTDEDEPKKKKPKKSKLPPPPQHIEMISRHDKYTIEGLDETCSTVADKCGVDIFDLVWMNQRRYPKLAADAPLKKGTVLQIPRSESIEEVRVENARHRQYWHVMEADNAFKTEAQALGKDPKTLLELNKAHPWLKGIQLSSILLKGTRLQLSGIDMDFDEYCHWTFPDDDPALAERSYMMARKLKPSSERTAEHAEDSVLVQTKDRLLVAERPEVVPSAKLAPIFEKLKAEKARYEAAKEAPLHEIKESQKMDPKRMTIPFKAEAELLGIEPRALLEMNRGLPWLKGLQLSSTLKVGTMLQIGHKPDEPPPPPPPPKLFNRVVTIRGEDAYEFWYVLTYLPDLQWCHVAPLETRGTFDSDGPRGISKGKPRWMLVSEDMGGEIDVGAGRCVMMDAVEMKGTKENADEEEWDILGEAPPIEWPPPKPPPKPKPPKPVATPPSDAPSPAAASAAGSASAGGAAAAELALSAGSASVASSSAAFRLPSEAEAAWGAADAADAARTVTLRLGGMGSRVSSHASMPNLNGGGPSPRDAPTPPAEDAPSGAECAGQAGSQAGSQAGGAAASAPLGGVRNPFAVAAEAPGSAGGSNRS